MSLFGNKEKDRIKELEELIKAKDIRIANLAEQYAKSSSKENSLIEAKEFAEAEAKRNLESLYKAKQDLKDIIESEEVKSSKVVEEVEYVTNELDSKTIISKSVFELLQYNVNGNAKSQLLSLNDLIVELLPYIHTETSDTPEGKIITNELTILTTKHD